jgi:hypothetical protein
MSYLANDITAPLIQIDSVAIGFQLDGESEARNINSLDLNKDEFLAVGEKTYIPGDTSNTKWSLLVNSQGTSVNASRNLARESLTLDTSLYVDKNIHCSGIIKAAGLELNNIRIDNTTTITSNLIREFIVKTNDLVVSQPFQTGYITNYNNLYNINYDVKNVYTPNFVTFGGHIDTFKNTHPLNIVTTPNNKFNSMHISIRNDTNNDEEPSRMCIGMIGGSNISPAIISTTRGVPLEFHVSTYSESINTAYGSRAIPLYNSNNVPTMTIDANNNVGIGTNNTSQKNYNKRVLVNNNISTVEKIGKSKLEVKGLSTFDDILLHDYQTNTYKHLDDIYIRGTGVGVLNATQINGGDFTDSLYRFNNNLSVSKLLNAGDVNIANNATVGCNLTTEYLNVNEHSTFEGTVEFNDDVNFNNVQNININNLNINNDLFINNKRVTPLNTNDTFTGNFEKSIVDGSNYIFVYVSSNIASLDANCNVNFPNKLGIGLTDTDGFDGVLNIIKNDRTTSNNFDILLKNTLGNKTYVANIGRLSRLDYNDNSLIFNTNKVPGKNNNIYFYPSSDLSALTSNRYLPNIKNTPPTLSLLNGKVGINKINPDNLFALDIEGKIAANDYYVSQDNNFKRTRNFIYNNGKNFFNLYDSSTDKFCINYNELISFASDMRGLNVKKGINADLYYQNNILLETLQKASSTDSFYTNKNISIGWNGEANVAPLQVRNLYTNDYNYSTIRIYRGVRGGGLFNNADYSGIDICEYDRDINQDRNKEKWFIYKNHKYNDLDARDYMRVGPLQIGYTDKTIEPTSYGMSFYYDPVSSKYHIDVNNPKVSYEDKSAMTIYGDLNVHGNVNILDNDGCNFNFTMKALSSNLKRVDRYINYISGDGVDTGYSASTNKIAMSIDILRPRENVIIDPVENQKIPVIIKNMNDDNPATKFITYSKSNICYSMIELAIYNSNLQLVDDAIDKQNNIRNAVQISVGNNNSNTYLDFNVYNNDSYKNFLRFVNTVSDNGDANSTIAHMGLGTDKSSNILFHIDGNEKYGLQITNNKYPASINLLNSEGKNIYHTISGGDLHNNHKFTIDVSSATVDDLNNEPFMTNVFTIDAFQYNGEKRRGARYGFNEDFASNINQTLVIKSDYDTVPMAITSRYSYEYMFNSTVKIDYDKVLFDILSSNWNNASKTYFSFYKQAITELPAIDANNNVITSNNLRDDSFIFKTNNLISRNLSYITVHSNLAYPYFFSNLDIDYMPLNNLTFYIETDSVKDKYDLFKENDFSLVPKGIFYSSNDDIKPSDISEKMLSVIDKAVFNVYDSNILFNYEYVNRYILSDNISCNIAISVSSNIQTIDNSNYFNISNYITTTFGTANQPFNALENVMEHTYMDYHQNPINLNLKFLEYSNIYLNTYTTNVLKYNSNIAYNGVFYSVHTNRLNIATSNIIFDELFELSTAYLVITSNIQDDNNIIFRTSNYSINNNANATQRNMVIQKFSSNVFQDTFDILGNPINKTIVIEEYFNNYCNYNLEDINIGIRNYNYKNYKPHISLINDVEKNDSVFEGHEIYSYDGVFEIKYANSTNKQFVPLKIDNVGNMSINGGLDMRGDLRFDGHIYDANGNDLIEILNKNYYKEYEINSSNIHFNSLGSNGLEINSYASNNHIDYKFLYVKDYLSSNVINDILVLHKSELLNNTYNLDLYADLHINCNLYIAGEGNNPSLSVFQKQNQNIIQAANLEREVLTVAYDGSLGLGVPRPQGVLLNARQNNVGVNIISASNLNREVMTVAYDGSIGFGVPQPRGVLLNARQNNIGSNIISASNLNREVLTVAYDGSIGFGVPQPRGVLLNARQNNVGSNIISASNLDREVMTVAYDGSIGFGVPQPRGVLLNARQNNVGSNIISASNLDREVLTVAYDGSIGFGVPRPQGVLLNARQNNFGSNIISASNLDREVLTVAYDGSIGFGVPRPQGVLLNARQNNLGSNIISASNLDREVLTVAYDGSIGFGVPRPRGILLNARQNNVGSNIISASNLDREVLTVAYDGSIGFGVPRPQGILLNARQNNIGSNIISASNLDREVLTVAYDGSIGLGVSQPRGILLNARQNNFGSNVISASNIDREVLTVAYDGSIGLGVSQPQGVLLNIRQNNVSANIISASNLNRELLTLAYDGSMGLGVVQPQGVLFNIRQNNVSANIISASNLDREVLTVAYDGSIGFGVTQPRGILLNARQNNIGSNIISASNINREVLTVAYDGSIGFGVSRPQGVLLNARQNNVGANIISASNIDREVLTVAYDGSIGFGVIQPQGVLFNIRQNNVGANIISASNLDREVLTVAYDGSIGFGVTQPRGILLNARQNNFGSNIISASNIDREVLTVAYDGSIGFGVSQPRGILLNARQNNIGSNIISASNIDREVLTVAYDGSIGFGVSRPQGVLLNARQNNVGTNIISASNIDREVLTVAYDGSIGFGVTQPRGILLNARQNNIGSNIISASNINREVLTVAYDGSIGFGVSQPQGVLLNARQNNVGANIISASNINREVLTVAYDGSMGLGVIQPQGVLFNIRQNNVGANIISASNLDREVLTVAYDGSIGFGVTQPRGILLNARQNNFGSNIISASNIDREVLTVAYDGSIGFGVSQPRGILLNARQNNIGSNIISASNLDREVLTVAYDGSIGFGVSRPQGVLLNARQNNVGTNIISASNLDREVLTVAYDGSIGFGVSRPQGVLLNARQNNVGTNIISASNIDREVLTVAYDGSIGFGVSRPQGVLLNARQNNVGTNIISASNIDREVLTVAYDGSIGFGVSRPQGVLLNARQNNVGANIISASNIDREVLTVAYDGSIGFGVSRPQGVLLNARQNNINTNIISASNLDREVLTVAYDGSIGFGVSQPRGILLNARQNNIGSNIISASNIDREVLTVAYDGSIGFGVSQPRGILLNARQNNIGSNIISASNIDREVLTVAYDGSIGFGVSRPQGVLLNARQNNVGTNIISASNLDREVLTVAYDGSIGFGVSRPQGVLLNARQNNAGANIISASNIDREVLTVAYDGSIGFGVSRPQGVLLNARQNNAGANIISASNIDREVLTVAYDGSIGFGVSRPQGVLLNARQNNAGANIISASNIDREVLTVAYDGSIGFGVSQQRGILLNARQNNIGSNIISASNLNSEVMTLTYDGIMGLGVTNPNKQSKLDVRGNINIVSEPGTDFVYTINNRDIMKETCNYILETSNFIATRITNLTTDVITENSTSINKFIVANKYNNNLFIDGDLTINSNLIVYGVTTTLNTDVYTTEQLNITNTGTGDALIVKQINNSYNIFTASNNDIPVFNINYNGKVGIGTEVPKVYLEINSTDGIKIPSGTDIQRPSGTNLIKGTIRYNTDTNQFEGYGAGNSWGTLGGVKDVNNDTFISAESSPGVNNDELRFITSNIEKMIIKKDGKVGIGTQEPKVYLEINTTDGIKIPSGTEIQRPAGINLIKGTIRYNTDTNQFEGYGAGNNWGTLGGVKDVNNDTFISAESAPGVNNDELRFITSNIEKMIIKKDGRVGIGTQEPKVYLEINSTDGIKIPSGTDIQRPSGINLIKGTIRYNTDTNQFEGYGAGNNWGTLGGVKDVNNDTFISAESAPGVNNDELRFITSNIEKMIIKTDGKVGIGKQNPEYLLDVQGDIRTNSNLFVNFNVGIGTTNISSSLLNIYGKAANIKIQNPHIDNPVSSIEFINGLNNSIQSNSLFGWRISNSNNNFAISSGKNNLISDRLIIDGGTGNIGIGTKPHIEMDNNGDTYKININGSINIEGDIYKQGVLFSQGSGGGTSGGGSVGVISQNMPIQTLSKTYTNTKSYLESGLDNDGGWKFIDENVNGGFLIKIKPSHRTSKILINLSMHIGIDSAPESIWWGLRLYRKMTDNNLNVITDWHEVVASRPENNPDNATPCWLSHTLGANLTSYENFVANINGTFFDTPDSRYNVYYTVKWKTNLGNNYGGSANIYLNRPAKYNSNNSSVLSSTWTATEIWQLGTPYIPSEGSNIITIYNQDFVGIGNTQPQHALDIAGDINITGTYKVNNEIFKTSQWTTNSDNNIYYNNYLGVGTAKPDCLLALSGANGKIKIHDDGINNDGSARAQLSTSIDLINGTSNALQYNLNKCGWRMSNSNNNYIISSGSNTIIKDRFIIDSVGNIGVGTAPNHKLDIDGIINAKAFNLNGSPFVLEFTQGMTIQTIHKTYSKTVEKELNSVGWVPIDIQNDGFFVKIKPSHIQSKVLVSMTCHIGMDYAEDSRWWGLQLYRKIGNGSWTPVNDANGTNGGGLECTPCWISHNLGADNSMYSHSIINVSGSYEDMPNTEDDVYYTAYWKSKLDNTIGKLYINRPAYVNNSNYPLTSSSWTASEIWNNGTPYKPITTTIAIAYDKVGIGMTPSESSGYKLEVAGNVKCSNLQCISVNQTSDARYKKNIVNIGDALDDINKLNPVSYLLLNQESADKKSYGFIAQELKEIFPEVVVEPENDNELYGINYTSIIPLLTKSIQELTKKIELQQNEINYLKQKL